MMESAGLLKVEIALIPDPEKGGPPALVISDPGARVVIEKFCKHIEKGDRNIFILTDCKDGFAILRISCLICKHYFLGELIDLTGPYPVIEVCENVPKKEAIIEAFLKIKNDVKKLYRERKRGTRPEALQKKKK